MTNWNLYQTKYRHLLTHYKEKNLDKGDAFVPWRNPAGKILQKRYYHSFTLTELKQLAQKTGFKIKEQYYSFKGEKTSVKIAYNTLSIWQK